MKTYAFVYFGAMLAALAITPIVAHIGRMLRILDLPGTRKVHKAAVPNMGGVAIIAALLAATVPVLLLDNVIGKALRTNQIQIIVLFGAAGLVGIAGLADDIRRLRVRTKVVFQIAAALALCAVGVCVRTVTAQGIGSINLGWAACPLTILWIVGLTNAVKLIDGLDGLAAGICAVGSGAIALFALYTGQPVMAVLMLGLLGSLTGFLVFNFNPARIFMGDCGSMFVGFFLAASSVLCANAASTVVGLGILALALGVPIFDTLFSMIRRLLQRRSPFAPDRAHLHHKLLSMGLPHRAAVVLIYASTLLAAGLGMFMMFTRGISTVVVFGCLCLMLILIFRMASSMPLRESINAFRHIIGMARSALRHRKLFEHAQLRLREAETFDAWWQGICVTADELGSAGLTLTFTNRDGTTRDAIWKPGDRPDPHQTISMSVPVRQRRAGQPPLKLRIDIPMDGSLESAGLKLKLFSRLMDENSLADLAGTQIPGLPQGPQ